MGINEGYGPGETLVGVNDAAQYVSKSSKSGVALRRFPGWGGKKGYLEAVYRVMGKRNYYVQVPFEWSDTWHHLALLWHVKDRRLEIYIDGKLAGKADPGQQEWYASPWDKGKPGGGTIDNKFMFGSKDHGKVALTLRDELYIYNRALTPGEIKANMELVKK